MTDGEFWLDVHQLSDRLMAQFFYPSSSDRQGVMVQGQGEATAPTDTARVVFQLPGTITLLS
ncbi:MAG TPA: hypothetical protein V6C95_00125 [Coleofasciculaceae cyanobacterium]